MLGSFLGALAASTGSYLVEAVKYNLPRLVVFLPSFWLLVPGSLGLVSTTEFAVDPGTAAGALIGVFSVVSAIALGLLVGAAVAQAIRRALRQARRARPVTTGSSAASHLEAQNASRARRRRGRRPGPSAPR